MYDEIGNYVGGNGAWEERRRMVEIWICVYGEGGMVWNVYNRNRACYI